jgi:putative copper export protein/mono/diheme cytochrome c family protein
VVEALIAVRAVHVAASVAAAGAVLFRLWVAAPALRGAGGIPWRNRVDRQICAIAWSGLAIFFVSAAVSLLLVAAEVSGQTPAEVFGSGALATLLTSTRFGHVWIARVAVALAVCIYLLRAKPDAQPVWLRGCAAVLATTLLGALALVGHGGATPGTAGVVHLAADVAHAIAAGAWVGGLFPFALLLAAARGAGEPPALAVARDATRRFSNLGLASVATLLATGIVNTVFLAGSVPALIGTTYGQLLVLKILLFVAMVTIAALNRLKLTPQIPVHDPEKWVPFFGKDHAQTMSPPASAPRRLQRNASIEAVLGLAIIVIIGALGTIPPALHVEPWWPLPFRFDTDALMTPPLRVAAVLASAAAVIAAAAVVSLVLSRRRRRAAILALLIALAGLVWNLQFFVVPAFPTSFYRSPTNFSLGSIARGHDLFERHCAGCHGAAGRGNGPNALALDMPTSDLTAAHVYAHSDGDLFWFIGHGMGDTMPGFGDAIDDQARWNLIDFVHANADAARLQRRAADGPNAFPAPSFTADCPDASKTLEDLRGRFVRLVVTDGGTPPSDNTDVVTIAVPLAAAHETAGACTLDEPEAGAALAVYRGDASALAGTQLLIDPEGRLRALWYPGRKPDWNDPAALARELATLRATPALARPQETSSHAHGH